MISFRVRAYNLATILAMSNKANSDSKSRGVGRDDAASLKRHRDLLTLGVDSATDTRSVALLRGVETLGLRSSPLKGTGAATLLSEIDRVLSEASVDLHEIELFAVASGPGSFTGLRSGIATVKAFGVVFGVPVVGVPTLHALAYGNCRKGMCVAVLPAGRGELFAQFLRVEGDRDVEEEGPPMHLSPARLIERVAAAESAAEWVFGGGADLSTFGEDFRSGGRVIFKEAEGLQRESESVVAVDAAGGLAVAVGLLAQERFHRGVSGDAADLRALYVRPSDAELNA